MSPVTRSASRQPPVPDREGPVHDVDGIVLMGYQVCDKDPRECCVGDGQARGGAMTDDEEEDAIESEYAAQRARIVAMREEGFTLEEIGEETDLAPEAVLEIVRKEGMK
jgi:hypothetical protein